MFSKTGLLIKPTTVSGTGVICRFGEEEVPSALSLRERIKPVIFPPWLAQAGERGWKRRFSPVVAGGEKFGSSR